jgi:hypothetical protein
LNGDLIHGFQHQVDFGFRIEGHGGSGEVSLPLTFVGFNSSSVLDTWESYQGLDLRDQIVLLVEGNAPADFPTEALIRGARGVLWIVDENSGNIQSEIQLADPEKYYLSKPTIPTFKISSSAAGILLEDAGLSLGDLFAEGASNTQTDSSWYTLPLSVRVHMSLSLSDPITVEIPCVLGYQLGSDIGIGNELIVVAVNYDGLGMDPDGTIFPGANQNASGISTLLEVIRLWQNQDIDSRRSVLVIAWGGGTLTDPGFRSFINNPVSIRHLPAQSGRRGLSPEAIIQFSGLGAGGDTLLLHPESSERLGAFLEEKALDIGVPVSRNETVDLPSEIFSRQPGADWIYFTWSESAVPVEEDLFENIREEKLENAGEILSYLLIKLSRQSHY